MAIAQQEQQQYIDRTKVQACKYKINDEIWLKLKNIITATENKKLNAKQAKYTILENMGFYNFRFDNPSGTRNVFHVDRLRAASADFFLPKFQMITTQAQRSLLIKTGPTNMTSIFFWLLISDEMEKLYSFYLGTNGSYGKHRRFG